MVRISFFIFFFSLSLHGWQISHSLPDCKRCFPWDQNGFGMLLSCMLLNLRKQKWHGSFCQQKLTTWQQIFPQDSQSFSVLLNYSHSGRRCGQGNLKMTLTSLLKDQLKIIALPFLCFPFRTFFFLEPGNTVLTQKDHKTEKKIQILNVLSRSLNLLKKGKK